MAKFVERFGALKTAEIRTAASGARFLRFSLDAGSFTVWGVSFKDAIIDAIAAAPIGARVWAKGPLDVKTVQTQAGERTYVTIVAQFHSIGDAKGESADAAPAESPDAETADAPMVAPMSEEDYAAVARAGEIAASLSANQAAALMAVVEALEDGEVVRFSSQPVKNETLPDGGVLPGQTVYKALIRAGLMAIDAEGDLQPTPEARHVYARLIADAETTLAA